MTISEMPDSDMEARWARQTIRPIVTDFIVAAFAKQDQDGTADAASLTPIFSFATQNTYLLNQDALLVLSCLKNHEQIRVGDILDLLPAWSLPRLMSILLFLEANALLSLES